VILALELQASVVTPNLPFSVRFASLLRFLVCSGPEMSSQFPHVLCALSCVW